MQTRLVVWCVLRGGRRDVAHTFFSRRAAAEKFREPGDSLFKVTWRDVEGGTKSVLARVANLALSTERPEAKLKRLTSMATWEPI
jgi:hypothetical protein